MADSIIKSEVRLNITPIRQDLETLKTAWKLAGKQIVVDLKNSSLTLGTTIDTMINNINVMSTRAQKGMSGVIKFKNEFKDMQTLFINLAKSDPTNKQYKITLSQLDQLIVKTKTYEERSAKIAKTKKENAKQEKENAKVEKDSWTLRIKSLTGGLVAYNLVNRALRTMWNTIKSMVLVTKDYEQSLANTQSVMQATTKDLRSMDTAARNAGETTRFTATQAADALYYMASAGFTANESIEALDGTLAMAQATGKSLSDTAQIMAVTIAQFGLKASESSRIANVLTAGITSSQATMDKYKTSLYQVGPVASGMGRSLEEVIGVLDVMYDSGMQASRSGRAMRNVLADLASESSATSKKLTKLGINFKDIDVTANSLVDVFGTLNEANLSAGQIMQSFGKVIGPQMQVLIRTTREELERYTKEVTNTNKAFLAAHIQNDTTEGDWYRLKSASEALGISIGNTLVPAMRWFLQTSTEAVRGLNKWIKTISGARSSANDMSDAVTNISNSTDEYTRLATLLNDKTLELTESERKLYEQRQRQSLNETQQSLSELSKSYDETLTKQEKLQKVETYTGAIRDKMNYWNQLLRLIQTVNSQENGATAEQTTEMKNLSDTINGLNTVIKDTDKEVYATGFLKGLGADTSTQINIASSAIEKFSSVTNKFGNNLTGTWEQFASVSNKYVTDSIEKMSPAILGLAENANDADVALSVMSETMATTIASAGRLYAEGALNESNFIGMNEKLVQQIKDEAKAYEANKKIKKAVSDIEYEEFETLKGSLNLNSVITDGIKANTSALYDNADSTASASKSATLASIGYDNQKKAIEDATKALLEKASTQREDNQEIVDSNENIGLNSKQILGNIVAEQEKADIARIGLARVQALRKVEEQRAEALGQQTTDELEDLKKLEKQYQIDVDKATEWANKVVEAQLQARESAIQTRYDEAKTNDEFKQILQDKIKLIQDTAEIEKKNLELTYAETEKKQRETSDANIDIINKESRDTLAIQKQLHANIIAELESQNLERINLASSAKTDELATLKSEYDAKIADAKKTGKDTTAIRTKYELAQENIEKKYVNTVSSSEYQLRSDLYAEEVSNAKTEEKLRKEQDDKVQAEKTRLNDWLMQQGIQLSNEQLQLIAYYAIQEQNADDEKEKLYKKEIARQNALMDKWKERDSINKAYIEMLDKQAESANNTKIAELKGIGDVTGALKLYSEASAKAEEKSREEALKTYDAKKADLDKLTLTDDERNAEEKKLTKEFQQAITDIETYYAGERDTVSKEYSKDEITRLYNLQSAWCTLTDGFKSYSDAIESAQNERTTSTISSLLDKHMFAEALSLQDKLDKQLNEKQKKNINDSVKLEKDSWDEKLRNKEISQAEHDRAITALEYNRILAINAQDTLFAQQTADKKVEYALKVSEYNESLDKEALDRQATIKSGWQELASQVKGYQKDLQNAKDTQASTKINKLNDTGQFEKAYALQKAIDDRAHTESLEGLFTYTNARRKANEKAFKEEGRTLEEYNTEEQHIVSAETNAVSLINETAHITDLERDEEYFKKKKAYWLAFGEQLLQGVADSLTAVGSAITSMYNAQLSEMETIQDRLLQDIQDRLDAELEANGVAEESAVESAQRALEEAKASADEETIIEKEKALKKAKIEAKYAEEKLKAEQDYAWKVAQIQYASNNTSWKLNMLATASEAALAIAKAVGSAPWPLNIPAITFASVNGGAQVVAQGLSKPTAPVKADYYASGGLIAGTEDGTPIIAGEKNKTEAIFNQDQMANLLMAIANGRMPANGGSVVIELVVQDTDKNELARYTVDGLNNSKWLLDPNRALKKVATR